MQPEALTRSDPLSLTLRPALAGAAATFAGVGLARFAYVPLFPAMVTAGWVGGAEAGLLGALNLTGYLVGVLGARRLARGLGTAAALDLGMALAVASFAGCGWNGGVAWLALCRGLAGIAGGVLMALAGPAVQGAVDPARRGFAGGIVVTGVAIGVVTGAFGAPLLLREGVGAAWLGLAALTAAVWLAARTSWPRTAVGGGGRVERPPAGAIALYLAYGLSAAGLVPHMVYFGDHAVRGRGLDLAFGSLAWLLFGIGGFAGPVLGGKVSDRFGAGAALRLWLAVQVLALTLAFAHSPLALAASALLGGFAALGLAAIALARSRELAGPASGGVWVQATAAFAVAQAVTGFGFAALFGATHSHEALFAGGLALSLAALAPAFAPARPAAR